MIMDNLEYLNQISKSNRPVSPVRKKSSGPLGSPIFKIAIGGIIGLVFILAFASLFSSLGKKASELTKQVLLRTNNLNSVVTEYNPAVKSSRLRAIGSSLTTVLTNSSTQLSAYLTSVDGSKDATTPSNKTIATETAQLEELQLSLTNAKLNGLLDRTYENQLILQVSLLLSLISELESRTNDNELLTILSSYSSNLETIHSNLESYSNTSST